MPSLHKSSYFRLFIPFSSTQANQRHSRHPISRQRAPARPSTSRHVQEPRSIRRFLRSPLLLCVFALTGLFVPRTNEPCSASRVSVWISRRLVENKKKKLSLPQSLTASICFVSPHFLRQHRLVPRRTGRSKSITQSLAAVYLMLPSHSLPRTSGNEKGTSLPRLCIGTTAFSPQPACPSRREHPTNP